MSAAAPSTHLRGIGMMVAGGLLLTISDTVTKWLTAGYPIGQIMSIRCVFTLIPIAVFAWHAGGLRSLRLGNVRLQCLRAGCAVASSFLFVTGLFYLPLADAIAFAFSGPLFVTALAHLLLGETVGWRRWSAVTIGFVGILVMLRPSGSAIQWFALLPLCAAFCGAFRDILTRKIRSSDSPVAILAFTMLAVALAGLTTLPFGWKPVPMEDLMLLATTGIVVGCAQYLVIHAFHNAEASLIIPFKYLTLIWGTGLGYIIWGDIPDFWVIIGAAVVVGSGLYIMYRETRRRQT
jgi:drug/metabolite transporter (DMT)-like permease